MMYLYLLGCMGFIALQGFFAASEISFISSSLLRLQHRQDRGEKNAQRARQLLLEPEKFLVTILAGTNLCVVLSSSLLTFYLVKLGVDNPNIWITFFFTPLVVIFAELIPKNLGRYFKEDFSCRVVGVIAFFEKLFFPMVKSIRIVNKFSIKVFIKKPKRDSFFVTKEEIKALVKEIEKEGGIDRGEKEAIEEVFELRSSKIKQACVGLRKIVALDYTDSYERILEVAKKNGFTRYPVFSASTKGRRPAFGMSPEGAKGTSLSYSRRSALERKTKEIAGYINIYDLFYNPQKDWHALIRPIIKVGLNQRLYEIFIRLKSKKESIALVVKGEKIYGIVTHQDLIREIITSIVKI
ncbi:MAG: DUF21 domain-containing protein [Candidatus Omnitrophica bacterium]|nr:DUF21 domain-containing protein [Candidatus Omnitrophota bacterium]MBU2504781.1 DUF21 domain-containing protein [Candidatus Omnitrophota bacterium]